MRLQVNTLFITLAISLMAHLFIFKLIQNNKVEKIKFNVSIFPKEFKVNSVEKSEKKSVVTKLASPLKGASLVTSKSEALVARDKSIVESATTVEVLSPPSYPLISRRLGEEGEVTVQIECSLECRFELIKSSGFARLDQVINEYMKSLKLKDFKNKKLVFRFVLHK